MVQTFTNTKETYQAALRSLFSGRPQDTEADLSQLLAPTFTIDDTKTVMDYAAFVSHIRSLREMAPKVTLDIVQFVRDGPQLAERHTSSMEMKDGQVLWAETFQFAKVAEDGRLEWIVESVAPREAHARQG